VLALLARQEDLELLDDDHARAEWRVLGGRRRPGQLAGAQSNRRVVRHYQGLVRTAVTLDALIEQELGSDQRAGDGDARKARNLG
jgi:hypothetical protein